jgi:hypothetical protein
MLYGAGALDVTKGSEREEDVVQVAADGLGRGMVQACKMPMAARGSGAERARCRPGLHCLSRPGLRLVRQPAACQ